MGDFLCIEGGKLDGLKLMSNIKHLETKKYSSKRAYGEVYESKWLELKR